MHKLAPALATLALITAAAPAFAEDSPSCGNAPESEWMSVDAISAKFTADGYTVRQVKVEDGCYEIYAKDKNGMKVETYVNPVTGAVVSNKTDD